MQTYVYQNYISNLQHAFEKRLDDISAQFNFELGSEFEVAICEILSSFLPNKFGICRGFAVNAEGATAGDDIIIYDKERFPTLRTITNRAFDKKDMVPIEAICAYIEAKHTLDANSFIKAVEQVQAVKQLCSQREPVSFYQVDPHVECTTPAPPTVLHWPKYRNPVFGMILSRYSAGGDGKSRATSPGDVEAFLREQLNCMKPSPYLPDLIVAGSDNYLSPAHLKEDGQTLPSLHYIPEVTTGYQVLEKPGIAFGAALAQLAGAIDWVRLGRMPWIRIVNDARFPESQET
ncbi:MAG: hypothetical protein DU489_07730 [Nitrosomonas sp.]|uniref:DUF6602 domain-containing protein n=1 Tax=Nitrosomonas sp. TaxID=42353 RepID=UPI0032EAFFEF